MTPLPNRVNLDHLKKQAKELIRLYRGGDRTIYGLVASRGKTATGGDRITGAAAA